MEEQLTPTIWKNNTRKNHQTRSRRYALGSFFETVLTMITDTKDGMGLRIKTDPSYLEDPSWVTRKEDLNRTWKNRVKESERVWRSRVERE